MLTCHGGRRAKKWPAGRQARNTRAPANAKNECVCLCVPFLLHVCASVVACVCLLLCVCLCGCMCVCVCLCVCGCLRVCLLVCLCLCGAPDPPLATGNLLSVELSAMCPPAHVVLMVGYRHTTPHWPEEREKNICVSKEHHGSQILGRTGRDITSCELT
mgnify:CR=1 FL=1